MDDPSIADAVLDRFHRDLARIHRLLGNFETIERFLRRDRDKEPIHRVLDIGCGAGELLAFLCARMNVEVIGVDRRPPGHSDDIRIVAADAVRDLLPEADVAVCTYLAHHLTPEENVAMIRNVARSCRRFVILDLVRHPLPLWLFSIFVCPFIGHEAAADGRLSVRRAYTPVEFQDIVRAALKCAPGAFTIDVSPLRSRQVMDIRFTSAMQ